MPEDHELFIGTLETLGTALGSRSLWRPEAVRQSQAGLWQVARRPVDGLNPDQLLAAKLLHPECQVMAAVGDGGFAMSLADLETAVREELPIVVAVMSDSALSLIEIGHERRGYDPFGVYFGRPDCMALAAGLGVKGILLERPADCRDVYRV